MDKARVMCSGCNAPFNLWDEFCATAAYLMNLTASSANDGKTPFELWYGNCPSLSHLQEIGCHAFALIPTNNPKIFHHSSPCVLIGYAPNSKAYHLWDQTTDHVFNTFHINFIEQFQSSGTTYLRIMIIPILYLPHIALINQIPSNQILSNQI